MASGEGSGGTSRRWLAGGLIAVALVLTVVLSGACSALRAGVLLRDAMEPPADLTERVQSSEVRVRTRSGDTDVLLFRPRTGDEALPALVLCHGAVETGARDSRLLDFARAFAARGMVVAVPHLPSLAKFRIDPADTTRIADVTRWLASESGEAEDGRAALAGVSVGGSYAIIAADDAQVRDDVSAVLAFGGYADMERLLFKWMTSDGDAPSELFDPLTEGRRLVLLGNVEHLVAPEYVDRVRRHLKLILQGNRALDIPLPPEASEVVAAAANESPLPPEIAERLLSRMRDELAAVSPEREATPLAPVHLLHATADPVVPTADLTALASALRGRGVTVDTHVTDLFGHVAAPDQETPGFFEAWPLLRFVGGFLDDAGL